MPRAPFLISAAIVSSSVALAIHLGVAQDDLANSPSALVGIGVAIFAVISTAGLLLSRGRWSRHVGIWTLVGYLALSAVTGLGGWSIVSALLAAAGLFGLTGPWLQGWIRGRPAAMGPGTKPVILLLATLALVPGLGVASPSGLTWEHWLTATLAVAGAWAYSRASTVALWAMRILALPVITLAATASPPAGATYLILHGAGLTYLAWSGDSLRAVQPLLERVYGARAPRPLDPRAKDAR